MEVYFKGESSLDSLSERLRELLNIPSQNKESYHRGQKRYGVNMGGEYYLFEIFGLTLRVLANKGEVEIPERADWPYYAFISVDCDTDRQIIKTMTEHLAQVARRAGLQAEVDQLAF